VAARQDLGLKARLRTDGRIEHLIEQLEQGIPCPVGRLHTGLVIGWDRVQCQFLMQDPNGEGDLVNGGYVNTALGSGQAQPYFERNWGRRWMLEDSDQQRERIKTAGTVVAVALSHPRPSYPSLPPLEPLPQSI